MGAIAVYVPPLTVLALAEIWLLTAIARIVLQRHKRRDTQQFQATIARRLSAPNYGTLDDWACHTSISEAKEGAH